MNAEEKTMVSMSLLRKIDPRREENQPRNRTTDQETLTIAEAELLAIVTGHKGDKHPPYPLPH